jgi:hypothetical protein
MNETVKAIYNFKASVTADLERARTQFNAFQSMPAPRTETQYQVATQALMKALADVKFYEGALEGINQTLFIIETIAAVEEVFDGNKNN